jgi:hypothetical protein
MSSPAPRSYTRLAVAIVAAALIIGSVTFLSISTKTTTLTTTQTVTVTSTMSTTVTSSASASNSSLDLSLSLQVSANTNGVLTVKVNETNLLDAENNVTAPSVLPYNGTIAEAFSYCGGAVVYDGWTSWLGGPAIFAIFEGNYGWDNYTAAQPLTLYNTTTVASGCPGYHVSHYAFNALASDSLSQTVKGYWTGGQASSTPAIYHSLAPGTYSIVALDVWGQVVLLNLKL